MSGSGHPGPWRIVDGQLTCQRDHVIASDADMIFTKGGGRRCRACVKAYEVSRNRWKHSRRRSAQRITDITPEQEAELRRKARKCPMPGCGVRLTDKPRQPNSKELDHILPVGVGGTHTWGNVRIICRLCNLKRPKDGSDFTGQLTLWAAAPGVSVVISPPGPAKPAKPVRICGCCGNEFAGGPKNTSRCHCCIVKLGQDAAALRTTGMRWEDIAAELGYSNLGNLHTYAVKYGGYEKKSVQLKSLWWWSGAAA